MVTRKSAALLVALLWGCAGPRVETRGSRLVGQPLALTAPDLDGRPVDVGAQTGAVRVVDFWATWCEPCKEAMPVLDRMSRELASRGLVVYGLSVDDDPELIRAYLGRRPVGFPILWDQGAQRLTRLGVTFMPVTLVVDRHGTIRYVHQGWDSTRERQQREEVETLLREP